jgi:hypothetical protein
MEGSAASELFTARRWSVTVIHDDGDARFQRFEMDLGVSPAAGGLVARAVAAATFAEEPALPEYQGRADFDPFDFDLRSAVPTPAR